MAGIAMILALVMAKLSIPIFNQLSGKTLEFNPFTDLVIGPGLLAILLIIGLLAGAAPALVLLRTSAIGMLTISLYCVVASLIKKWFDCLPVFDFHHTHCMHVDRDGPNQLHSQ